MNPYERQQIATMATKVVDVLGDAEDALWELEDEQVVVAVQQALARMCEYLGQVRDSLPKTDEERKGLAENLTQAIQEAQNSSGAPTWSTLEEERAAHEVEERLASAVVDPQGRDEFIQPMNETRARLRMELASSARRSPTAEEMSRQFQLVESAVDELRLALATVDEEDIKQIAEASVALARFATTAMRTAAMTVAVTALSEEEMGGIYQRHSRNRSGATVEQLDDEGEDAAEKGHTFRRTRLLWPPLLPMVKSGGAAVVKAIRGDAFLQLIATVFVVLCFPIWLPILMILALILVPMLVVDELLQRVYTEHVANWKVTVRVEEAFWAALSGAKVWFLMARVTLRQSLRFASRQIKHAQKRPGGLIKLAKDTTKGAATAASSAAKAIARDPMGPWRFVRTATCGAWEAINEAAARAQ